MNPGRLNKRVTLQKRTVSKGADGRSITTWTDVCTLWASVEPLRGREYHAAAANNAEGTIRVRIRYRPGVTADMRLIYGSRILEMNSPPIDPLEGHKELHLMCRELMVSG